MLIMFYGDGCPHCETMEPLVARLEKEKSVAVARREVWNNAKNAALQDRYDKGICGGVPFFVNTRTRATLCGAATYRQLKMWASRK
jgi:thiol-disulfide isomerase/thioredoxin